MRPRKDEDLSIVVFLKSSSSKSDEYLEKSSGEDVHGRNLDLDAVRGGLSSSAYPTTANH